MPCAQPAARAPAEDAVFVIIIIIISRLFCLYLHGLGVDHSSNKFARTLCSNAHAGARLARKCGAAARWSCADDAVAAFAPAHAKFELVIVCGVFARRLSVSASFAQYHGGFGAVPIGRSPLGRGILLSWIALAIGYAWSFHALRSSRRL